MKQAWISFFKDAGILLEGSTPKSFDVDLITSDSRQILKPENAGKKIAFFARKGVISDSHDFLPSLEKAANVTLFVAERVPENFKPSAPVVVVRDSVLAMALAAK